jgi:hypothetical protein
MPDRASGVLPAGYFWRLDDGREFESTGDGEMIHLDWRDCWIPELNQFFSGVASGGSDVPIHSVVSSRDIQGRTYALSYLRRKS